MRVDSREPDFDEYMLGFLTVSAVQRIYGDILLGGRHPWC